MLLAHFVGDVGRKRIEADVVAGPAWPPECRTFPAAASATGRRAQSVARCVGSLSNDSDRGADRQSCRKAVHRHELPRSRDDAYQVMMGWLLPRTGKP
jgi:hypothetical protein